MQFSSINFENPSENLDWQFTINEEDLENEIVENESDFAIENIEEIVINNPIKIDTNKRRKQGVQKDKLYNNIALSFKEVNEKDKEKNEEKYCEKDENKTVTFDRNLTSEALDLEFFSGWVQGILSNLNEGNIRKQLKRIILKKEIISFFNEELLDNEVNFI